MNHQINTILISRTDSIGDVVLTLPLLGLLKKYHPLARLIFLGQAYTRPVLDACVHMDEFVDWNHLQSLPPVEQVRCFKGHKVDMIIHVFPRKEIAALAHKAGIPQRIGTLSRYYHLIHCNKPVWLSRRRSPFHEAQLNILLLKNIIGPHILPLHEMPPLYGLHKFVDVSAHLSAQIDSTKVNLIFHPKSKGSGREWGSDNFAALANILPADKFKFFITGTQQEGDILRKEGFFDKTTQVCDLTGQLDLGQLIAFIHSADGLVAASTGPLHLAAALGKVAVGLYPPIKPMHPGRWAPLGPKASCLVLDKNCNDCRKGGKCQCMLNITPWQVREKLYQMLSIF